MKLYYLQSQHLHKLPFKLYKDRLAILARVNNPNPMGLPSYQIIRDYTLYEPNSSPATLFILFNLEPEDFTHLNIFGIPIRPGDDSDHPRLERAITRNHLSISYEDLYK